MLTLASGIKVHNTRNEDGNIVDYPLSNGTIYCNHPPSEATGLVMVSAQTNEDTPAVFWAIQASRSAALDAVNALQLSDFDDLPNNAVVHLYQADSENTELLEKYKSDGAPIVLFE